MNRRSRIRLYIPSTRRAVLLVMAIIILSLVSVPVSHADTCKYEDAEGRIVYSWLPQPNLKKIICFEPHTPEGSKEKGNTEPPRPSQPPQSKPPTPPRPSPKSAATSGTGFFVSDDGYLLTCNHVIENATKIEIRNSAGKAFSARLVRRDPKNDLALLKVEGRFFALPLGTSATAQRGVSVITVGFPLVAIQGIAPKLTEGIISSTTGLKDDPTVFQVTVPIQLGNSGGPLVTREGNVIGVVSHKLSSLALLEAVGDVPQNVNYAVKVGYARELVMSGSTPMPKLVSPRTEPIASLPELSAFVERATVLVTAK